MNPNKLVTLTIFQQLAFAKLTQNRLNDELDEAELAQMAVEATGSDKYMEVDQPVYQAPGRGGATAISSDQSTPPAIQGFGIDIPSTVLM